MRRFNALSSLTSFVRTQKLAFVVARVLTPLFIIGGGLWEYAGSQEFCGRSHPVHPPLDALDGIVYNNG